MLAKSTEPIGRDQPELPVVVIGAGPVGLAAAAHLLARGLEPLVLEAGDQPGASVAEWGHVRLFSPWRITLDPVAVGLLTASGWIIPDLDALPTGAVLLERYVRPLAALPALARRLRLGTRVVAVTRTGMGKVPTAGRNLRPFTVRTQTADGTQQEVTARAVIDASGTWTDPNPLGAAGIPALGEPQAAERIITGIPDVLGIDRARFAGRRVLVVGAGHSAATTLLNLADLQNQASGTEIVWVVRSATPRPLVGKGEYDELPARGSLSIRLRGLLDAGRLEMAGGFRVHAVSLRPGGGVALTGRDPDGHEQVLTGAVVVNATGFRPDHSIARELRLGLDPALESPAGLAELIDPNVHTCGTVPVHGAAELAHPEPGYWVVGMKSYGRAPTFLLSTGYAQVASVVATITGDRATRQLEPALA